MRGVQDHKRIIFASSSCELRLKEWGMMKQLLTVIAMMILARLAGAENIVFPADTGVVGI